MIIADSVHVAKSVAVCGPSSYGNQGSPQLFEVHIYDETGDSFPTAFNSLPSQGYQAVPWIIGEAFYNDAAQASSLRQQANSTGQKVLYSTQWPLTSDESCSNAVNGTGGGLFELPGSEFLSVFSALHAQIFKTPQLPASSSLSALVPDAIRR
ncbi:MAG TPA: hypothetical protein VIX14_12930 [Terriglobales bacterium]